MFTKRLYKKQAVWFAGQEGLEMNKTMEAFAHDSVHAVLGLGVTLEEEELVLNVQQSLIGKEISSHMVNKVTDTLAKLINQDIELFMELQTFIESVFA